MGASKGHKDKSAAETEAQERCAQYGATDCKVLTTYKNQCVAYATAQEGRKVRTNTGASRESATQNVLAACSMESIGQCKVLYTDCTEPLFKSY